MSGGFNLPEKPDFPCRSASQLLGSNIKDQWKNGEATNQVHEA
jgi:hypothetical protein